jgi:hypothetical protein
LVLAALSGSVPPAPAATPNMILMAQEQAIVLHFGGPYITSAIGAARFKLPFPARLIGVSAGARTSGGTSPTLTVDLQKAGASVLAGPISVTAGSVTEGAVAVPTLDDESIMTVNLAIGGGSPSWADITVTITLVRQ